MFLIQNNPDKILLHIEVLIQVQRSDMIKYYLANLIFPARIIITSCTRMHMIVQICIFSKTAILVQENQNNRIFYQVEDIEIIDFANEYNLHDSFIIAVEKDDNNHTVTLTINFAFCMQKDYVEGSPDNGVVKFDFKNVQKYHCEEGDPTGGVLEF